MWGEESLYGAVAVSLELLQGVARASPRLARRLACAPNAGRLAAALLSAERPAVLARLIELLLELCDSWQSLLA